MEVTMEQLVKLTTQFAFSTAMDILEDDVEYMSEHAAKKKFKGQLELWERGGLIKGIPTSNGKHKVYSKRRLTELWYLWTIGL